MLNAKSFGLAGGILWGALILIITLIATNTNYGAEFLNLLASIYPGYKITYLGSIIGLIYGFIDGFVGCYIFAWLYNKFEKK